jgi:hypothetical protein
MSKSKHAKQHIFPSFKEKRKRESSPKRLGQYMLLLAVFALHTGPAAVAQKTPSTNTLPHQSISPPSRTISPTKNEPSPP